jgi:hypothetical protein
MRVAVVNCRRVDILWTSRRRFHVCQVLMNWWCMHLTAAND